MKKKRVVDVVRDLADAFVKEKGLEIVDVEFVKEGPFRYLRITIDREEGVSLDDCSDVSKFLNGRLDELDPIEENYFLEVTSPGVERELKRPEDFARYAGKTIQLKLFTPVDGQKLFKGTLVELRDSKIVILRDEEEIEISKDKVSSVKLVVDFGNEEDN